MELEDDINQYFIADANFFISGTSKINTPQTIYTTGSVLNEIRDKKSVEILKKFEMSHKIVTKEPSEESIQIIRDVAEKSGNLNLLSDVDISLLAVANDFLVKLPQKPKVETKSLIGEWITPENYGNVNKDDDILLCTADSTMQIICQIVGIPVMSPNGDRVAEVKRWLLRCSSCEEETYDASKEFCPLCGSHSLIRYAIVIRDGVEKELPLPERFRPTRRGTRYTTPGFKKGARGGRNMDIRDEFSLRAEKRKLRFRRSNKDKDNDDPIFFQARYRPDREPKYGAGPNPNAPKHYTGKRSKR